jgi:hypothetical protein
MKCVVREGWPPMLELLSMQRRARDERSMQNGASRKTVEGLGLVGKMWSRESNES